MLPCSTLCPSETLQKTYIQVQISHSKCAYTQFYFFFFLYKRCAWSCQTAEGFATEMGEAGALGVTPNAGCPPAGGLQLPQGLNAAWGLAVGHNVVRCSRAPVLLGSCPSRVLSIQELSAKPPGVFTRVAATGCCLCPRCTGNLHGDPTPRTSVTFVCCL